MINGIEGIHVCKTENLPGERGSYEILVSGVKDCIMMWDAAQRGEIDGVYYEANQPLAESGKQIIWSNGTAYIIYSSFDKTWVISESNTAPTGPIPYLYAADSDGFPDETIEFPWNATSWCFSLTGPCGISVTLNE